MDCELVLREGGAFQNQAYQGRSNPLEEERAAGRTRIGKLPGAEFSKSTTGK